MGNYLLTFQSIMKFAELSSVGLLEVNLQVGAHHITGGSTIGNLPSDQVQMKLKVCRRLSTLRGTKTLECPLL